MTETVCRFCGEPVRHRAFGDETLTWCECCGRYVADEDVVEQRTE